MYSNNTFIFELQFMASVLVDKPVACAGMKRKESDKASPLDELMTMGHFFEVHGEQLAVHNMQLPLQAWHRWMVSNSIEESLLTNKGLRTLKVGRSINPRLDAHWMDALSSSDITKMFIAAPMYPDFDLRSAAALFEKVGPHARTLVLYLKNAAEKENQVMEFLSTTAWAHLSRLSLFWGSGQALCKAAVDLSHRKSLEVVDLYADASSWLVASIATAPNLRSLSITWQTLYAVNWLALRNLTQLSIRASSGSIFRLEALESVLRSLPYLRELTFDYGPGVHYGWPRAWPYFDQAIELIRGHPTLEFIHLAEATLKGTVLYERMREASRPKRTKRALAGYYCIYIAACRATKGHALQNSLCEVMRSDVMHGFLDKKWMGFPNNVLLDARVEKAGNLANRL
jgi:hypothetical protein